MHFKDALLICTLGITWKEERPTAPSGVLDPGGVEEEEVTSGKQTLEYRIDLNISREKTHLVQDRRLG